MTDNPREALLKRLREAKGADPEIDMLVADFFGEKKSKALRVCVAPRMRVAYFIRKILMTLPSPTPAL